MTVVKIKISTELEGSEPNKMLEIGWKRIRSAFKKAGLIKQGCRVKIVPRSQLNAPVILLFTEFGVVRPCEEPGLQPHLVRMRRAIRIMKVKKEKQATLCRIEWMDLF